MVEHLKEITPAGTTGECLSVLLIIISGKIREG